jgi:hypothetical protein
LNRFLTIIIILFLCNVSYCQQDNTADICVSVATIKYQTKPVIGIVGNSTVAAYARGEAITALMNKALAYSITDISVLGYIIHQEDSMWRKLLVGVKQSLHYVFDEIGLNDLKPEEPTSTSLSRYQSFFDLIRRETDKSCRIITRTMTPADSGLFIYIADQKDLLHIENGLI